MTTIRSNWPLTLVATITLGMMSLALLGCSPESKAQDTLEKYEVVFDECKKLTEKEKMQPGQHRCGLLSSMALDASLEDTGLQQEKIDTMRDSWLKDKGYAPFYIPKDERKPEPR